MSDSQSFQTLLPVDITFYRGESPSPAKLNGIFNYIQASYYVLESYLGNGTDYLVDESNFKDRKMLHNLAGAIGKMGDLYRPINKLGTLKHIHSVYGANNHGDVGTGLEAPCTSYIKGTGKTNEYLSVDKDFNIPVQLMTDTSSDYYLVVNFRGRGNLSVNDGISNTNIPLDESSFTKEKTYVITGGSFIDHIKINTISSLEIYSISLLSGKECYQYQSLAFNVATSMPLDQDKFWTVKAPCLHAYTNDGLCSVSTCQFCIGNTYDLYIEDSSLDDASRFGLPVCGGDYFTSVPDELKPDAADSSITYTPYDPAGSVKTYAMQSSLLMTSKGFMAKYRPFAAFDPVKYSAGDPISKNESVIYDKLAAYSPVFYDIILYATSRPDIIYLSDIKNEVVPNTNDRYFAVGGAYSVTSLLSDILKYLSDQQKPTTAVYAD